MRRVVVLVLVGGVSVGCAKGSEAEAYELPSGFYELLTTATEGDCAIDGAVTPGGEHVGKVARVEADTTNLRVTLQTCDDFFPDSCVHDGLSEELSLLRNETQLFAEDLQWPVPGCTCFETWRGVRRATGRLVDNGSAELTWSFEIGAPPADCLCEAGACSGTIHQRLEAAD